MTQVIGDAETAFAVAMRDKDAMIEHIAIRADAELQKVRAYAEENYVRSA